MYIYTNVKQLNMLLRQLFFSPKTTTLNPSRAVFDLTTYIFAPKRRDDSTKPLNIIHCSFRSNHEWSVSASQCRLARACGGVARCMWLIHRNQRTRSNRPKTVGLAPADMARIPPSIITKELVVKNLVSQLGLHLL
jgi:hypothetical protein